MIVSICLVYLTLQQYHLWRKIGYKYTWCYSQHFDFEDFIMLWYCPSFRTSFKAVVPSIFPWSRIHECTAITSEQLAQQNGIRILNTWRLIFNISDEKLWTWVMRLLTLQTMRTHWIHMHDQECIIMYSWYDIVDKIQMLTKRVLDYKLNYELDT